MLGSSGRSRSALLVILAAIVAWSADHPASAGGWFLNYTLTQLGKSNGEGLKKIVDTSEKLRKIADGKEKFEDSWDKLSEEDDQYEPDYDPAGMPELPALCKGSEKCEECFYKPSKELDNLRFRFEKLRKINRVTKNMLRDYLAWGDAAATAGGGLVPLAWAKEKAKVRASEANFNASYDAKHKELLGTLLATLQALSACEESVFGEQGWYERYGFVYYQFMATAYVRPN